MNHIIKHPFYTVLFICIGIAIGIVLEKVRHQNEQSVNGIQITGQAKLGSGVIAIADSVKALSIDSARLDTTDFEDHSEITDSTVNNK